MSPSAVVRAEVVAIGTELLLGDVVDTNSAWISTRLAEIGVDVVRHTAVGDDVSDMSDALAGALSRAEVVLVTGGLGPTQDDLTRLALAAVAGVALVRDPAMVAEIEGHFAAHGRVMPDTNLQQADLPDGAWWLSRVGSAPGIGMAVGDRVVFCMPGVPREMQVMVDADVVPELQRRRGLAATVSRVVRTAGLGEGDIAQALAAVAAELEVAGNPTLAFLASRGEAKVKLTGRASSREAAIALVEPVLQRVVSLLGPGVVGLDDEDVEADIGRRLRGAGLTLAVAESITGGGVGARLVTVPGASEWFRGGLVTYATEAKAVLAGLDRSQLDAHGPVSAWAAESLAAAAAERLDADVGLAVTGVAGPAEQGGQPVGTVWLGVVGPDGLPRSREVRAAGRTRLDVQESAAAAALALLHRSVLRLTT